MSVGNQTKLEYLFYFLKIVYYKYLQKPFQDAKGQRVRNSWMWKIIAVIVKSILCV